MPAAVVKPAARVLFREERDRMLLRVPYFIPARQSALTAKLWSVFTTQTTSVMRTMWTSRGAVPATAVRRSVRLLRRSNFGKRICKNLVSWFVKKLLTGVWERDILFKRVKKHASKQSIHSHLTAIEPVSVHISIRRSAWHLSAYALWTWNQVDSYAIHFFIFLIDGGYDH